MTQSYRETPCNFSEIVPFVKCENNQIISEITQADKCYFYDTCSFRKHANMEHPEYVCEFIIRHHGVVVITRGILMELASVSGTLNSEYIMYMKKMYMSGIKVLVMYEEELFDILSLCFSSNMVINRCLSLAVKTVKRRTGTVESTLKANKMLMNEITGEHTAHSVLYKDFFRKVRQNKESGDNLGEELLTICVHVLANIPESYDYKYVIITEDKGAIGMVNQAANNVFQHNGVRAFSALTTNRLAQRLHDEGIISEKYQVEEVLSVGNPDHIIKILGSEEYDLLPKEKTMSCEELAEKITTPNAIHINY